MTRTYYTTCICGHEEENHFLGYGECQVEGCLCAAYEPEEEEWDTPLYSEESGDDGEKD